LKKSQLEVIVCPVCHGKLKYIKDENQSQLICKFDRLLYRIDDGIPILIADKAQSLTSEQVDKLT